MRNRMYGGVRGRETKVGRKLLHFPPTRFPPFTDPRSTQSTRIHGTHRVFNLEIIVKDSLKDFRLDLPLGYFCHDSA